MKAKKQEKWAPNLKYRYVNQRGELNIDALDGLDTGDKVYVSDDWERYEPAIVTSVKDVDKDFVIVNCKIKESDKVRRYVGHRRDEYALGECMYIMALSTGAGKALEKAFDEAENESYKYVKAIEVANCLLKFKEWLVGALENS